MSNKSKLRATENCQADLLTESGVENLNALKHKQNHSDQCRSQDFKFGNLIGSELEQILLGRIKDILKLDIQKLIYQTKYSNLQIVSSTQSNQNFGMVCSFHSCDVTHYKSSTPISSNCGSQQFSLLIVVMVALVINLGNRKQLLFVSNIFILNILKVLF